MDSALARRSRLYLTAIGVFAIRPNISSADTIVRAGARLMSGLKFVKAA